MVSLGGEGTRRYTERHHPLDLMLTSDSNRPSEIFFKIVTWIQQVQIYLQTKFKINSLSQAVAEDQMYHSHSNMTTYTRDVDWQRILVSQWHGTCLRQDSGTFTLMWTLERKGKEGQRKTHIKLSPVTWILKSRSAFLERILPRTYRSFTHPQ